jgi:putative endonuclease
MKIWYVYLLGCADGTLYCGATNDLKGRVEAHNAGTGAKYTRGRRPVTLVYYRPCQSKQSALRTERNIKKLPRKEKQKLLFPECVFEWKLNLEDLHQKIDRG